MKRLSLSTASRSLFNPAGACFLVNFVIILGVFLLRVSIPPVVPLFYGLPQGEEQLASQLSLIYPPLISIIFIFLNIILSNLQDDPFLNQVLIAISFAGTLFSTITIIKIIFLVGSF